MPEAGSEQPGTRPDPVVAMACGSRARPGHPPPAPLACVPTREGDGCLALVPAPVGNNKRDADPRAP